MCPTLIEFTLFKVLWKEEFLAQSISVCCRTPLFVFVHIFSLCIYRDSVDNMVSECISIIAYIVSVLMYSGFKEYPPHSLCVWCVCMPPPQIGIVTPACSAWFPTLAVHSRPLLVRRERCSGGMPKALWDWSFSSFALSMQGTTDVFHKYIYTIYTIKHTSVLVLSSSIYL